MGVTAISLNLIVCLLSSTQAQVLFLPVLSAEYSGDPYQCTCNYTDDIYDPICGNNGLTYINFSEFYCEKKCKNHDLIVLYKGSCKNDEPELRSRANNNLSEAHRSFKILNKCPCSLNKEYNPVCGSNGITYDNISFLLCDKKCKQPKLTLVRYGLCREEEYFKDPLPFLTAANEKCDCIYSDEHDPICGTDGYTYPNYPAISCVSQCLNPSLKIVHYGPCVDNQIPHNYGAERCNCISSSDNYDPICADNGITYDNLSMLSCAQRCLNRDLEVLHENPCREYLDIDGRKLKKQEPKNTSST